MKRIVIILFCFLGLNKFIFSVPDLVGSPLGVSISYCYFSGQGPIYLNPRSVSSTIDKDTVFMILDHYSDPANGIAQGVYVYSDHGGSGFLLDEGWTDKIEEIKECILPLLHGNFKKVCIEVCCASKEAAEAQWRCLSAPAA